eukprot:TRINITY_DN20465_c0_g1_i1.p1 TRINITY_DN20465_c0_g1~~TRINITY_DN20465_c0_g1_i1.p1  ORF type:complete len:103 (-),score=41.82 TRINITY_DN20465_c0_g1_i1:363-671(-)
MIRRPPRSTLSSSSAASDVYKRQVSTQSTGKLANLTFQTAQFKPEDIDCHPSLSGGVLLVVNGECMLDQERHGLKFNDVFHLAQDQGNWFISNQLFRIVGGN